MAIQTAFTNEKDSVAAVEDLKKQMEGLEVNVLLYFASSSYNQEALAKEMQRAFSSAQTLGCSTAGEIVSGQMLKNSVVAMGFDRETISEVAVAVVENVAEENRVEQAFTQLESVLKAPMSELDFEKYVGLILTDGLSGAEEKIMDTIGNKTDIQFIGGSAGDDLAFAKTWVCTGGKAYTNATVLAVIQPEKGFDFIKTQSFETTGQKLTATEVDEPTRTVKKFNEEPALEAFAKALEVSNEDAKNLFMRNPVGLMVGEEPYVRSPQQAVGTDMKFYCEIKNGMELSVLSSKNIVEDTKKDLDAKMKELGGASALINFNCILRTLELEQNNQMREYGDLFKGVPTIGFSTYGESYIGHINQTATILVLK